MTLTKSIRHFFLTLLLTGGALTVVAATQPARACAWFGGDCRVAVGAMDNWWQTNPDLNNNMKRWLENTWWVNNIEKDLEQNLILKDWWEKNIRPALMEMTGQLVAANVDMTGMVGGFFDGRAALQTQLTLQKLHAQAIKDYTPGENLCRLGTGARSLALSEEKAITNAIAMAEMAQNRQLGTKGAGADSGPLMDQKARFQEFRRVYCDPADNDGMTKALCNVGNAPAGTPSRMNKDINFTRTVATRSTLDLDFTNGTMQDDEEDVLALSRNLYGHDVFQRMNEILFSGTSGNAANRLKYLDLRQLVALHSVAQNSFDAITAMRARGAAGSSQFLRNVLRNLGMSDEEAKRYIGDGAKIEPSYYAQMEVLTKKLYQDPNFYVNLIDKPAEVARVQTAMQGFGLMNDNDLRKSLSRQEMLLSMLLEMRIRKEQDDVQRKLESLNRSRR